MAMKLGGHEEMDNLYIFTFSYLIAYVYELLQFLVRAEVSVFYARIDLEQNGHGVFHMTDLN